MSRPRGGPGERGLKAGASKAGMSLTCLRDRAKVPVSGGTGTFVLVLEE